MAESPSCSSQRPSRRLSAAPMAFATCAAQGVHGSIRHPQQRASLESSWIDLALDILPDLGKISRAVRRGCSDCGATIRYADHSNHMYMGVIDGGIRMVIFVLDPVSACSGGMTGLNLVYQHHTDQHHTVISIIP